MTKLIQKPTHYFKSPRSEMLEYIPKSASNFLEIGCGEGSFSQNLKQIRTTDNKTIYVTAIEIDPLRAEKAREKLDYVICANIEDEDFFDNHNLLEGSFDCIICNDVLEHLVSPWNVLEQLKGVLTKDGVIVASIPNVRYLGVSRSLLFNGEWNYTEDGILDITHLRFFTRSSIEKLFKDAGYTVVKITGINSFVRGWKFSLLNFLTRNHFDDIQYLQFAVVAKKL